MHTSINWPLPMPLSIEDNENIKPYPVDALPALIRDPIHCYQTYGQQPLAMIACSALANISLACQTLANVARDHLLVSPVSLFFILAAQSGERKTAADKAFGKAIRQWQEKIREEREPEVEQSRAIHHLWKSDRDALIRQMRQTIDLEQQLAIQLALKLLTDSEPSMPLLPEFHFEDTTQEGLTHSLSKGWPSSSLWSDEAGIILSGAGMQANSTKFITTLSRLWDGNPFIVHRKSSPSFVVNHRRFSMSMMVQPLLLEQLIKKKEGLSRHSGFLARALIAKPVSQMGNRYYRQPPRHLEGLTQFHERITDCLNQTLTLDQKGCHDIPTLHFSNKAKTHWVTFFDRIEAGMNKRSHWLSIQDFASKSAENVARLSALFHLFLGKTGDIETESVEQAIEIVFWHLLETKRLFESDAPEKPTQAQKLLKWLKTKQLTKTSSREIQQLGRFRHKEERNQAIQILIEHHYLIEAKENGKGILLVNPKLLNEN